MPTWNPWNLSRNLALPRLNYRIRPNNQSYQRNQKKVIMNFPWNNSRVSWRMSWTLKKINSQPPHHPHHPCLNWPKRPFWLYQWPLEARCTCLIRSRSSQREGPNWNHSSIIANHERSFPSLKRAKRLLCPNYNWNPRINWRDSSKKNALPVNYWNLRSKVLENDPARWRHRSKSARFKLPYRWIGPDCWQVMFYKWCGSRTPPATEWLYNNILELLINSCWQMSSFYHNYKSIFRNSQETSVAEELLDRIEQKYIEGDFDECLSLIDRRFMTLRTHYP